MLGVFVLLQSRRLDPPQNSLHVVQSRYRQRLARCGAQVQRAGELSPLKEMVDLQTIEFGPFLTEIDSISRSSIRTSA